MAKTRVKIGSARARRVLTAPGVVEAIRQEVEDRADQANSMANTPRRNPEGGEFWGFRPTVIDDPRDRAHGRVYTVGNVAALKNARENVLLKVMGGS